MPTAIHGTQSDGSQAVGLFDLKVVLLEEDGIWFAQGLDLDYSAQGDSLEQVKHNFEQGLCYTIHENLQAYGTIAPILKSAPGEVWQEFFYGKLGSIKKYYTHVFPKLPAQGRSRSPGSC